jgi:hypothetical protein
MNRSLTTQHAMVSVFHQMHCLVSSPVKFLPLTNLACKFAIREGYYDTRAGEPDKIPAAHLNHCFDYIRQAIMCFSDMTLEWIPEGGIGSTGWGYQHTCRNYEAVKAWTADRKWKDVYGIH